MTFIHRVTLLLTDGYYDFNIQAKGKEYRKIKGFFKEARKK